MLIYVLHCRYAVNFTPIFWRCSAKIHSGPELTTNLFRVEATHHYTSYTSPGHWVSVKYCHENSPSEQSIACHTVPAAEFQGTSQAIPGQYAGLGCNRLRQRFALR